MADLGSCRWAPRNENPRHGKGNSRPAAAFQPHLKTEEQPVRESQQQGVLRGIHSRQVRSEAVLIVECSDAADAHCVLGTLPLGREGLITFEVIPLKTAPRSVAAVCRPIENAGSRGKSVRGDRLRVALLIKVGTGGFPLSRRSSRADSTMTESAEQQTRAGGRRGSRVTRQG